MNKKIYNYILIFFALFPIVFALGCIPGLGGQSQEETVLAPTQGVGLTQGGFSIFDNRLKPDTKTVLSVKMRNNAEGQSASNVIVTIDNIEPFKLIACNNDEVDPNEDYSAYPECGSYYDLDLRGKDGVTPLRMNQHGTLEFLPGQELEFMWSIQSPTRYLLDGICMCDENANAHPIYYTIDYDYRMITQEDVTFMSQEEYTNIKNINGSVNLPSKLKHSAGEFRLKYQEGSENPNLKLYYPTGFAQTMDLDFEIENVGRGFSPSGVSIVVEYPEGVVNSSSYDEYGWKKGDELEENITRMIRRNFPDINMNRMLYRHIKEDRILPRIKEPITIPLELTKDELNNLIQFSIPQNTYSINIYLFYTYRVEDFGTVSVLPIITLGG